MNILTIKYILNNLSDILNILSINKLINILSEIYKSTFTIVMSSFLGLLQKGAHHGKIQRIKSKRD